MVIGDLPPFNFRNALRSRIDSAIKRFEQVTDKSLIVPVLIKIRLFTNKSRYESYRNQVAPDIGAAPAFYSSARNESAVYLPNINSGLTRSTHEAMHAINRAWFGQMNTWLNEGMAEVAELKVGNPVWKKHIKRRGQILLSDLINADQSEWRGKDAASYYAMSWAFTRYLLEKHPRIFSFTFIARGE